VHLFVAAAAVCNLSPEGRCVHELEFHKVMNVSAVADRAQRFAVRCVLCSNSIEKPRALRCLILCENFAAGSGCLRLAGGYLSSRSRNQRRWTVATLKIWISGSRNLRTHLPGLFCSLSIVLSVPLAIPCPILFQALLSWGISLLC